MVLSNEFRHRGGGTGRHALSLICSMHVTHRTLKTKTTMNEPMNLLNTAVIGCGVWGRNHARVYKQIPDIQLKTVVDADETRAREIGELYKVK